MNTMSRWIVSILAVIMGLFGLLLTSRAEDDATGLMGLIMFAFAVFFVMRQVVNADRPEED